LADTATAPYWPAFQGPRGDNVSDENGLLRVWPADGPPLLWTAQGIGQGYSSVSLARGLIYTAGNINDQSVVTALDLQGTIRWQTPAGGAWTGSHPGTRSTPTIDDDRIYFQNPLGELFCLEAANGKVIWNVNVLERFGASNITWALAESILVDGRHVISTPGGPQTTVVKLDKMTGETVWQSPSAEGDPTGYATPTLVEYMGKRLILTFTGKAIICVDADTGKLYWRFPHETSYDVNALKPIFHDGQVFVSSGYGSGSRMLKVKVTGDQVEVEEIWTNQDLDNHHGGVLLRDGYLYGSKYGRDWACLEWVSGRTVYSERGVGKGSLTCADGMLYTLSEKLDMGLVAADAKRFEVVSRFRLPSQGDGPSWAYPVVCGGRLYLRHDNNLFCYDVHAQ
jgi:outer membrane protein assembly factor BamB